MLTADELRAFEREVADAFEAKQITAPIHLSDGNEEQLIEIFKNIDPQDWVFSTWRSHFHALLHGVPRDLVMKEILAGRSMMLHFPEYRFFTSAIVGGILPIACGVAALGDRVWCFIGDMTASIGAFRDAKRFAIGRELPITFVIEDNGLATNSPTAAAWGYEPGAVLEHSDMSAHAKVMRYAYQRTYPHVGSGVYVSF